MSGSTFEAIKKEDESVIFNTYARYPIAVSHGKGSRLWDYDGKEYIDLLAGIAVVSLGHANDELADVIAAQARKLLHVSNLVYHKEQQRLARRLLATAHCGKAFFCNSGAEANEGAIKLARRYQQRVLNTGAYEIITFEGCFHGRTLATLAATGRKPMQDGFDPMPEGFTQVSYGDLAALERAISGKTAAVMLEMVQGEGGIRPATKDFAQGIAKICRDKNILFIADEVQTGLCRTGKWWGFQNFDILPDIITSAKALGNGLPIGAFMATDAVAKAFVPGSHATTYGGNVLTSAVAERILTIMERDKIAERAGALGDWAMGRFREVAAQCPGTIKEVRGMGLMMGIELAVPAKPVWEALTQKGFIMNLSHEKILRLVPALTIAKEDLEFFAQTLKEILSKQ